MHRCDHPSIHPYILFIYPSTSIYSSINLSIFPDTSILVIPSMHTCFLCVRCFADRSDRHLCLAVGIVLCEQYDSFCSVRFFFCCLRVRSLNTSTYYQHSCIVH
jgi:hypothetical protein